MELTRRNFISAGVAAAGAGLLGMAGSAMADEGAATASEAGQEAASSQAQDTTDPVADTMLFHSICILCKDFDNYLKFWTDFMGFKNTGETRYPSSDEELAAGYGMSPELCDDIFDRENHSLRVAMLVGRGVVIEINCPDDIELTPEDEQRYWNTGLRELAFQVDDLDYWFDKVKEAGYYITTSEPWSPWPGGVNREFIFADPEGNLIQLSENNSEYPTFWEQMATMVTE